MELVIEELPEVTLETFQNSPMADVFDNILPLDATVVTVKIDLDDKLHDVDENRGSSCFTAKRYLESCGVNIIATTAGLHKNGKNQKPHIHYHLICDKFIAPSNPSQHRKRWASKNDEYFEGFSFKYQPIKTDRQRFEILAYPYKEGLVCKDNKLHYFNGELMKPDMIKFLRDYGKTIYDLSHALRVRQDLCQERKQNALLELYDLVKDKQFTSFQEMMIWLDENFICELSLEEYPDPRNYKINCQKIAIKKGILKYSNL